MVAYGERLLGVPVYELYNPGQRLLLAVLESIPGSDGGRRMNAIICLKHRYIDQMGGTPCPECEEVK